MTVYVTFRNPRVFSVWMRVPGTACDTRDAFVSSADEHFFGLGKIWNAKSLDLKGHKLVMANDGGTPDQGGHVPFYVSTRGYGVLVDNYLSVGFDFSSSKSVVISSPRIISSYGPDEKGYVKGSSMLWYFYYGPDLLDVIGRFTEHVSRSALPPPWAVFAPWYWLNSGTTRAVYKDARGLRDACIPTGLMFIDNPWSPPQPMADKPDRMEEKPPPFAWGPVRYPEGGKMAADVIAMGYKLGIWVAEWEYAGKNDFERIMDASGTAKLKSDAQAFIRDNNLQMYKLDRGNLQSIAPYFSIQGYYETWHEVFGDDFVTLPRVIANRGQKYVSGKWPGDCDHLFEKERGGLQANIMAFLNYGITGFAFWGSDVGGFDPWNADDIFARWSQFGAVSPIMELIIAGDATAGAKKTVYEFEKKYQDIYRKYAVLYTQLYPYRWTYSKLAHQKGYPIGRPLVLHYPDDVRVYDKEFEFLVGDWILTAPEVKGKTSMDVYLPKGEWIDWWSGERYRGGKTIKDYDVPMDKLPLFMKAGAIIPMIEVTGTKNQTWMGSIMDPLIVRVCPSGNSSFAMAGDQRVYKGRKKPYTGLPPTDFSCSESAKGATFTINGSADISYRLKMYMKKVPSLVTVNGKTLSRKTSKADLDKADGGWFLDTARAPGYYQASQERRWQAYRWRVHGRNSVGIVVRCGVLPIESAGR